MGKLTIDFGAPRSTTTAPEQDARLGRLVADDNQLRAQQGLPPRSVEQYLLDVMLSAIKSYEGQMKLVDAADAAAAYKLLSTQDQAQIVTLLGGHVPFPKEDD